MAAPLCWFGPVSEASQSGDSTSFYVVASICIIGFAAAVVLISYRRNQALKKMIQEHGWTWIGDGAPRSLPLNCIIRGEDAPLSIRDCFTGTKNAQEFYWLECRVGSGKRTTGFTILAIRGGQRDPFQSTSLPFDWNGTEIEGWSVISRERRMAGPLGGMQPSEIAAFIESFLE
jgi:hypothetical protein